jgi:hypothetical protein
VPDGRSTAEVAVNDADGPWPEPCDPVQIALRNRGQADGAGHTYLDIGLPQRRSDEDVDGHLGAHASARARAPGA